MDTLAQDLFKRIQDLQEEMRRNSILTPITISPDHIELPGITTTEEPKTMAHRIIKECSRPIPFAPPIPWEYSPEITDNISKIESLNKRLARRTVSNRTQLAAYYELHKLLQEYPYPRQHQDIRRRIGWTSNQYYKKKKTASRVHQLFSICSSDL